MDFMLKLFSFLYASFYTMRTVLYLNPELITRRVGLHKNLSFVLMSNDDDCTISHQSSRSNMDDYQFLFFQVFKKDSKISRKSITLEKIFWRASTYSIELKLCGNECPTLIDILTKFQLNRINACLSKKSRHLAKYNGSHCTRLFIFVNRCKSK